MLFVVGRISADFRTYLNKHTINYGLFGAAGKLPANRPEVTYELDFTTSQTITGSLGELNPVPEVSSLIVTGYEHYVLPAAIIAHYFGVAGMSTGATLAATDKIVMREKFARYDATISPDYTEVQRWQDIAAFMDGHSFPVMLKPANLMKSLYVTRNSSLDELRHNYEQMAAALPAVYSQYGLAAPRIIIEECLIGSMHTVAGFVDGSGSIQLVDGVVDCQTAQDIGMDDSYLFSRRLPSTLSAADTRAIRKVTAAGVAALGLTNTAIHAELMLTGSGPKLIEIGARMGGYRPRMYAFARGIDMYQAAIATATGRPVELAAQRAWACTVLELFSSESGTFRAVEQMTALAERPSCEYVRVQAKPGELTGRAADGFRAPLVVLLGHADAAQVDEDVRWIREHVSIAVQPA